MTHKGTSKPVQQYILMFEVLFGWWQEYLGAFQSWRPGDS